MERFTLFGRAVLTIPPWLTVCPCHSCVEMLYHDFFLLEVLQSSGWLLHGTYTYVGLGASPL